MGVAYASLTNARAETSPPAHRIKLLTFLHSYGPGGVERVALRLNAAWAEAGAEPVLVIGRNAGPEPPPPIPDVRTITLPPAHGINRRTQLAWMLWHLPAIIRRERPDVLFCAGNTYSSVAVGMKLALGRACPPIIAKVSNDLTRSDMPLPVRLLYRRWLRFQRDYLDVVVGMASPMRAEIARAMALAPEAIAIVHDPALRTEELDRFAAIERRPADAPEARRFLAIGRLKPQKNFALLIRAFARIATPADRLTILGEGPARDELCALAVQLGVGDRLVMPGHIADLVPWLADADVFVMSSDYEGVPAVLIEAIAARLSIVATDCSVSMRDLLGDGACGTLVPVGDEAALAAAMAAAPTAPRSAAVARAHAQDFTLEQGAAAYLALMNGLIGVA